MTPTPQPLISELFLKDPMDLTESDFSRIVEKLREERQQWLKAEAEGKTKSHRSGIKQPAKPTLSIDDLEL
jgi:hypothetical protein